MDNKQFEKCSNPLCHKWPSCLKEGCTEKWQPCPIDFKQEAVKKYEFIKNY